MEMAFHAWSSSKPGNKGRSHFLKSLPSRSISPQTLSISISPLHIGMVPNRVIVIAAAWLPLSSSAALSASPLPEASASITDTSVAADQIFPKQIPPLAGLVLMFPSSSSGMVSYCEFLLNHNFYT